MQRNLKQFERELKDRYRKKQKEIQRDEINTFKELPQTVSRRFKQHTIIIDNTNSISNTGNPNEFTVELLENLKNVVAIRLLRSEYTMPAIFAYILLNGKKIPYSVFNSVAAYIYLNGYSNLKLCNNKNNELFAQISVGIDTLPAISNNFFYDPYAYVFNPIEKKLNRFNVKVCDGLGDTLPNNGDIRLILTLAIYTLEYT